MKKFESKKSVCPSMRYNVEGFLATVSFTEDDFRHCSNCIDIVEYLLSPNTDGESLYVTPDDIEFLARLLHCSYDIMSGVVEASEGSDNDI